MAYPWKITLVEAPFERFSTLTLVPDDPEVAKHAWKDFVQAIRYGWKVGRGWRAGERYAGHKAHRVFEYVRVLEYGAAHGMKHYHVAHHGSYVPQAEMSTLWEAQGGGRIVDTRTVQTPGMLLHYLTDYLSKGGMQRGERKISVSKGLWPNGRPSVRDLTVDVDGEHRHAWQYQGNATADQIALYAEVRRHGGWEGKA
jgi:hypothetical protein